MRILLYLEIESYVKVNGNFIGVANKNIKLIEYKNNDFLEFIPLNKKYLPTYYNGYKCSDVKEFDFLNEKLIIPLFETKRNLPYKVLFQKKFNIYVGEILITIVQDGFYKFFCDGAIIYCDELPFNPTNCNVEYLNGFIVCIFYGEKTIVYSFSSEGNLFFKRIANTVEISEKLITTNTYNLIIPTSIISVWDVANSFSLLSKKTITKKTIYDINNNLLPTAFFQLIAVNADTSFMLYSNLKERESELHEFIGNPYIVFPYYKDITKTVVVTKDKLSVYKLEFLDGLISNVIEE